MEDKLSFNFFPASHDILHLAYYRYLIFVITQFLLSCDYTFLLATYAFSQCKHMFVEESVHAFFHYASGSLVFDIIFEQIYFALLYGIYEAFGLDVANQLALFKNDELLYF